MKKFIMLLLGCAVATFAYSDSYILKGTVVSVVDGDTLSIRTKDSTEKIRLLYIDAPEISQKYGDVSKNSLLGLSNGKKAVAECTVLDRYNRHLCVVQVGKKILNAAQVERGLAWAYVGYLPQDSTVPAMQAKAKKSKLGLWSDPNPIPPWSFRHSK